MDLDIYLNTPNAKTKRGEAVELLRKAGYEDDADTLENLPDPVRGSVYSANLTHNLGLMAEKAGIYTCLWQPEELGISKAGQLIEPLKNGLAKLKGDPEYFKKFNSPNGWGHYENFVSWVREYLEACEMFPDAIVDISR